MGDKIQGDIFWKFDNDIDSDTCKRIISIAENKWETASTQGKTANKVRKTKIYWTTEKWLYDLVFDYMNAANINAGWNFEIDSAESMQIGKYGRGCFYETHIDGNGTTLYNDPENKFKHGKTRKLSMTVLLNEGYEGGELNFTNDTAGLNFTNDTGADSIISGKGTKGSVIVFPSYHCHSVEKITKGTRYSLVVWFLGKGFR